MAKNALRMQKEKQHITQSDWDGHEALGREQV